MTRPISSARRTARAALACAAALAGVSALALTASSAAQQSPARCKLAHLGVRAGQGGGAAGSELVQFAFVNRGSGSCTLDGYPHITLLDSAGRPLPTIDNNAPPGFDSVREKLVTLAPGHAAWFGVYFADRTGYGNLTCPTAARLRLRPPQLVGALTLSGRAAQIAPYGGSTVHLQCGKVMLTPVSARPLSA